MAQLPKKILKQLENGQVADLLVKKRVREIIFSDPQIEILESNAQVNLFYAGVGSGKTHLIGARNAVLMFQFPTVRGFIGANTYEQLNKSTLVGVFRFWASIGLKRDKHYVVDRIPPSHFKIHGERLKSYKNTISFANGKLIFLSSLDNYSAIDGIEFGHADLDETKDTAEEAVKEVIVARLRQKGMYLDKLGNITGDESIAVEGYNPLNIYTSPAKTPWIAEWFEFDKHYEEIQARIFSKTDFFRKRIGKKLVVISSTYHNERNLPIGFIERLIEVNAHNQHRINMLVYGSPLAKSGNEFYSRWDSMVHIKKLPWFAPTTEMDLFIPEHSMTHVGFDFNRKPYISGGLYKVWYKEDVGRWHIHRFSEHCLPPPNNVTEDLCNDFIATWSHELANGIFYYGDYSGKNRRTNSVEDDFQVVERVLKPYIHNTSNKVIVNERVVKRKEFMNKMFYGSLPIDFTCDPSCKYFIADCDFLQEGPDGKKYKQLALDDNGKSYEKYGHTSDECEYVVTSVFEQYFDME